MPLNVGLVDFVKYQYGFSIANAIDMSERETEKILEFVHGYLVSNMSSYRVFLSLEKFQLRWRY